MMIHRNPVRRLLPVLFAGAFTLLLSVSACTDSATEIPINERAFLDGTADDPQIGFVVNSIGNALRFFQLGDPERQEAVELGAGSSITPVGFSYRDRRIAVPLGNAASIALISPDAMEIERFFLFPSGNTTGSAFADDNTLLVANTITNEVGRIRLDQSSNEITETISVAPVPTAIAMAGSRAVVVSSNLEDWMPIGNGVVTILDPTTLDVLTTVDTGDENPQDLAVGPDGLVYVVNTGNWFDDGSVAIIDPASGALVDVVSGFGVGPGSIHIDGAGIAYVSGFSFGTIVWNTNTRNFIRGPSDPVCAPLADGGCRGAAASRTDAGGRLYQSFFGSAAEGLPPYVFVYQGSGFALADSIPVGEGPMQIGITTF